MGHVLADQRYPGNLSTAFRTNGADWFSDAGGSSHVRFLEGFNPTRANDVFRWIPKGLMWDLNDNTPGEQIGPVFNADQVNGYTNAQFFNALDADVRSPQMLRDRLLQENGNRQQPQVLNLFQTYGY